ncbi:MAG: lipoyl(octanoyl) transferase LipB [Gemmatimonadetes bacterium]|nr:lipoyl(octanoyl) transferase LipB [Gemmatimonadota bacterium]
MARLLEVTRLGIVEYEDGLDLQEELRRLVTAGEAAERFLLLQHPPVITLGRNTGDGNVVASPDELARRGIACFPAGRGGDVTFHGPGQIVGYPIVNLHPDRRDVRRYVRDLEEVLIRTLADFGVASGRIAGLTGVWVGDLKVAAIGVRISRWVTTHGFALNVATDLSFFETIVPCGITDRGVANLSRLAGEEIPLPAVEDRLVRHFADVFEREVAEREISSRSAQIWLWREGPDGREVLLLHRVPAEGDFWQPVTGLLEAGEAPAAAAAREVREETGLALAAEPADLGYVRDFRIEPEYLGDRGPHPWINREHAFAARIDPKAAITLSPTEHDEYLWTDPETARQRLRWNGNRRALDRLERELAR